MGIEVLLRHPLSPMFPISRQTVYSPHVVSGLNTKRDDVMNRVLSSGFAAIFCLTVVACGGGDSSDADDSAPAPAPAAAPEAAPAATASGGSLSMPDWMSVDEAAQTVTLDIVAGQTDANNHWNLNGLFNGAETIVVPEGYAVTIHFSNADPVNIHSLALIEAGGTMPAMFNDVPPAIEGAETSNPTSMTEATATGASETLTFTASPAGDYDLVCMIPAHAFTGMWIGFQISASGEVGVRM